MTAAYTAAAPIGVAAPAHDIEPDGPPVVDCPACHGLGFDRSTPGFECVTCAGLQVVLAPESETTT